jgi:uncharacterized iron-regulated membrane protein
MSSKPESQESKSKETLSLGRRLFAQSRVWHRRAALVFALPLLITITTGILLLLRGDFAWIQPKSHTGSHTLVSPNLNHDGVLSRLKTLPQAEVKTWKEVSSVIFNPGKGIYQVRLKNNFEIQLDADTGNVLNSQFRTSSLLTELHEGAFFHPLARKWIFLPSGIVLLTLWLSGLYLFFFPKMRTRKAKKSKAAA